MVSSTAAVEQIKAAQKEARIRSRKLDQSTRRTFPGALTASISEPYLQALSDPGVSKTAELMLGNWEDTYGNSVSVYSTDAYSMRPAATLSRPPRPDIHLPLRPAEGGGWHCGGAVLDPASSSYKKLHWVFPDGSVSVWTRDRSAEDTALWSEPPYNEFEGVNSQKSNAQPVQYVAFWVPCPPQNPPAGQAGYSPMQWAPVA